MVKRLAAAGLLGLCCAMAPAGGLATQCELEQHEDAHFLQVHLGGACTDRDREAHPVEAGRIMTAITQGKAVDLSGIMVVGELRLDELPLGPPSPEATASVPDIGDLVRRVSGAFSLVNSVVKGRLRHESASRFLVMSGPATFAGTTFEAPVDLSHTVFTGPVTLSGAVFLKESYFVAGRFLGDMFAERAAFGPHTRFHRSHFYAPASFQQSGFNGLAEFLEVQFDKTVDFSRAYFRLGTGFSGSRFGGVADFSEALFDREAFFTFTRFDGDVSFRRATFRSMADFDDARFGGRDDFSKVMFEGESRFTRVARPSNAPAPLGLENPQVQYGITLSLLVFSALLIAYLIRSR